MRPLKLEMKGFSAFRDETEVDFADIELLALVGPTGSGKSSIIDAMTFALFGSAARYGERDVAPVINQLSNEARVRFTFEVSSVTYSATRVVRRTKVGGSIKEARLERDGVVLASGRDMSEAVSKVLGLDFQRFNKTVVLPQGRFAEFLHDTPKDRQALLQELFGFSIYEQLGRRAREIAAAKRNEAEVRERSIAELGDLSDEHLADLEAVSAAVTQALAEFDAAALEYHAADRDVVELERHIADAASRRQLLTAISVPDGVEELSKRLDNALVAEQAAAGAKDRAREELRAAQRAAAEGPDLLVCQQLLDAHERQRALLEESRSQAGQIEQALLEHDRVAALAQRARDEIADARLAAQAARSAWDDAAAALSQAGDRTSISGLITAIDRRADVSDQLALQQRAVETATSNAEAADEALTAARLERKQIERMQPALALAEHLHVGEPCPVCRHTVEQLPDISQIDDGALRDAHERVASTERARRDADRHLAKAQAAATSLTDELSRLDQQLRDVPDREALFAQLELIDRLTAVSDQARQRAKDAETELGAMESAPTRQAALADEHLAATTLATLRAVHERTTSELDALTALLDGKPDEPTVLADAELARHLAGAAQVAQAAEEAAEKSYAACAAARAAAELAEREARREYADARESVIDLKPPKPAGSLASDWDDFIAWCAAQVDAHQVELEQLSERSTAARERRSVAKARIDELVEGLVDDVMAPLDDLRAELIRAEAEAQRAVEELLRDRGRAAKVTEEVSALRADASVSDGLGKLLRADGFSRWLLIEAMNELVDRATVRLRELTADQYSLVADDGAFKIVDHRNADEIRDVRSLSGGETFLTSLSLALALADSTVDLAAEGAAPMESIFLDEGFGTLDPDTLEVVAGTIEDLGASGRMVGIVTHIRDLAERMPTRIEVAKGPNGSVVQRVDV